MIPFRFKHYSIHSRKATPCGIHAQGVALRLWSVICCACLSISTAQANPEVPGAPQEVPVALVGGTVHPVSGPAIENGIVLFDKGKIVGVGAEVELPEGTQRVDVAGKHLYPGLIDPNAQIGLVEIDAVRASKDLGEVGSINPNVKAEVAVNPDSEMIPVTRSNGVLLCLTAPSGGLLSGTSALLQLDGWTYEEMTVRAPVAMHMNWPRMTPVQAWWMEDSIKGQVEQRDRALADMQRVFAEARAYHVAKRAATAAGAALDRDARLEAMIPVLERKVPLIVAADELRQIHAAVAFAEREQLRIIIFGGYDAPECADLLKKYKVPVIVAGVYRLPLRRADDYDASYTLPARLAEAEIPFCIAATDRFATSGTRNLPFHAAMSAAYGLSRDLALRSITLDAARILGVADRVGSLEPGKDATLIVTNGDPLETATQIESAFIQGRAVDLDDRHKRLYRKYQEKYERLKKVK